MEECIMNKKILIGGAWPYANGSLHIGHIAGLLPGDVLARYHRADGDQVYYVSGSDCHGTPVAIRAKQDHTTPREISDRYHAEFTECFKRLGFSYDEYTKTSSPEHIDFIQKFHRKLYESEYVYEKESPQAYCEECNTFLADRFVTGTCPKCGAPTRGDQCDDCGTVLEPETLVDPICAICGNPIRFKTSKHLYIAISKLEKELKALVDTHPTWRKNAIHFTNRYIDEGLRDRALTRDLDWGIPVPKDGYDDKTIYIWAENVLGYLSASEVVAKRRVEANNVSCQTSEIGKSCNLVSFESDNYETTKSDFREVYASLWDKESTDTIHYYVHGKDNIPFHTIILPSLLLANGGNWRLPDKIISSEYCTLEGRKISTSKNYAIWIKDLLEQYDADSIRYYFLANGPEKKDADFSWNDYILTHNADLVGIYGNFINRTLAFIAKYYDSVIPSGTLEPQIQSKLDYLFQTIGTQIENGAFKDALHEIFDYIRFANKYFDDKKPWATRTTDPKDCEQTLFNCVQIIANISLLLSPFLPFSSEKVQTWLSLDAKWTRNPVPAGHTKWASQSVPAGYKLPQISILFERIDKTRIAEETEKLKGLL